MYICAEEIQQAFFNEVNRLLICAEEREQAFFNEVNQAERRRDKQRKLTNKQEQPNNTGSNINNKEIHSEQIITIYKHCKTLNQRSQ